MMEMSKQQRIVQRRGVLSGGTFASDSAAARLGKGTMQCRIVTSRFRFTGSLLWMRPSKVRLPKPVRVLWRGVGGCECTAEGPPLPPIPSKREHHLPARRGPSQLRMLTRTQHVCRSPNISSARLAGLQGQLYQHTEWGRMWYLHSIWDAAVRACKGNARERAARTSAHSNTWGGHARCM